MTRRRMGSGSAWRVHFGRAPAGSPMRGGGCLGVLLVAAMTTTALVVATTQAMGFAWT